MVLGGKMAVGLLCIWLGWWLTTRERWTSIGDRRFFLSVMSIWAVTRIGLFLAVYALLGMEVTSDVAAYYYPQACRAVAGEWIYRDFVSSYAPGFPYLLGQVVKWIWNSPKAVVGLAVLVEAFALAIWMAAGARLLPALQARRAALLYVASAVPLLNVALEGQNNVMVALLGGIALWLYAQRRSALAAAVLSLPLILVKFLALFSLPAFLFRNTARVKFTLTFLILPALVFGFLIWHGVDVLVPVKGESGDRTSGNLPFLLDGLLMPAGVTVPPRVYDAATLAVLSALCLWLIQQRPQETALAALWGMVLLLLTLLLVSKKAYTSYLVMSFYPVCAVAAREALGGRQAVAFGIFGMVAVLERSLWFRWLGAKQVPAILGNAEVPWAPFAVFVLLDLLLIGFYLTYWRKAWLAIRAITKAF